MTDQAGTHRDVWRIAAPMILSNLSVPLLGIVDTAVMGHLDEPRYLGAVSVGATIFGFLYIGLNFLRMGTTGLAAQAFGTGNFAAVRTVLAQAVLTALTLALLLLLVQVPVRLLSLWLISAGPEVTASAANYYDVRIWSAPATLANYAFIGWFLGLQRARAALYVMLSINLTNVALDLVFVLALGMKVRGVAAASVFAECAGLAVSLFIARGILRERGGAWDRPAIFALDGLRRLFAVNANLLVRTLALIFAFAFLTAQGARQGEIILAANAVLMNFQHVAAYGLDGFAHAAEALVGHTLGAGKREAYRRTVRVCMQWAIGVAVAFALFFALTGGLLIEALTDIPEIRRTAFEYLPWLIASPLISVWSFVYDGIFVGATRAREMRNSMLLSTFLVYIPAWYLLRPLGNHGLWLAFLVFMAARGISMHWLHRRF